MVIGAVLSTDMVHHFAMVSKLEVFYELHAASIQAHHRALRQGLSRCTAGSGTCNVPLPLAECQLKGQ
jgi:hypothetical protein